MVTVWGDTITEAGKYIPSFFRLDPNFPVGMVADPLNERKFYFSNPQLNVITSFRDLLVVEPFGDFKLNSNGLSDYEYPTPKPPRTYRILLVGNSISYYVNQHPFVKSINNGYTGVHQLCTVKRLELELNTLATLDDTPFNFEVLSYYHQAFLPLLLWPYYEVPKVVEKNDIDLVLFLETPDFTRLPSWTNVNTFYNFPMAAEGIPSAVHDAEYSMKGPLDRIPDGEPRDFYELCKKKNLVSVDTNNNLAFDFNNGKLEKEPEIKKAMYHMCGKPIDLLYKKLSAMKNSAGKPVRFLLCFTTTGILEPRSEASEFWSNLSQEYKLPFLNLSDDMAALRVSYYPSTELFGASDHFTSEGHLFFSHLLAHELIRNSLIPWNHSIPTTKGTP
jgi:hypothetical protein